MKNLKPIKIAFPLILLISTLISLNGQSRRLYVKPSFTYIHLAEKSKVNLAGTSLKNTFSVTDSKTFGTSIGYKFTANLAIDILVGIPPSLDIIGKNEFEGITLGSIVYAPFIISLDYKIMSLDRMNTIIGVGFNYTNILKETDGAVDKLTANNFLAPSIKFGLDFKLSNKLSLTLTANKIIKGTTSVTGSINPEIPNLGGAPVTSEIELNPTAIQFGIAITI